MLKPLADVKIVCTLMILLTTVEAVTSKKEISPTALFSRLHSKYSQLLCVNSSYNCSQIACSNNVPLLDLGKCATYNGETRLLSIAKYPYYPSSDYNVTIPGYIQLPANLTQLNDYMCGPMNRKGVLCSECADGFGPSVTSFKYKCTNCTDAWYGIPLFLFLEFVPITVFYVIILVFQISVTSAPMPCFILYSQLVAAAIDLTIYGENSLRRIMFAENGDLRLFIKAAAAFYGIFNLDFFRLLMPPFCISRQLKSIHITFLGYISVFYPILLIFLTWLCVELHGCNFRPLVMLWRPFHRCFVQLRRRWNTKSDICDVFTTFFLLSYTKILHLTLLLMSSQVIHNIDESGNFTVKLQPLVDRSILFGSTRHLVYGIPSVILCFIFNILPPLLLILYPIPVFRQCLSKCHLDFISVSIFVDKIHSCYRNGLDGGRDMRSFSGLYFFLIVLAYFSELCVHRSEYFKPFFMPGTLFLIAALTTALIRPYQAARMNILDSLLLSIIALVFYDLSVDISKLLILKILLLAPIATLLLTLLHSKLYKVLHNLYFKFVPKDGFRNNCFKFSQKSLIQNSSADCVPKEQPLNEIQTSCTIINYGAC